MNGFVNAAAISNFIDGAMVEVEVKTCALAARRVNRPGRRGNGMWQGIDSQDAGDRKHDERVNGADHRKISI